MAICSVGQPEVFGRNWVDELKSSGKPFAISKWEVQEAYRRVNANKGAAGVDGVSLAEFEKDLKSNLTGSGIGCRRGRTSRLR